MTKADFEKQINIKLIMVVLTVVCLATFFVFTELQRQHTVARETTNVENHAAVVSTSLWSYEPKAPKAYLSLALEANGYERVTVYNEQKQTFLDLKGTPYTTTESVLLALRLLHKHVLEADIFFEGKKIGLIRVIWPYRSIYLHLYILFCMALFLIGFSLFLKLLDAKRMLAYRVHQRTEELESEIKERQKAEQQLKIQSRRLAVHIRHTPLAVIDWSIDFRIAEWNNAAENIFGYSREEVIGKSPFDLIIPSDEKKAVEQVWTKIISHTGGIRSRNTNLTKTGELKTCEWFNTTLINEEGVVIGAASLVLDITDQVRTEEANKALQEQLLQSQKMEAVGNLAGGIAHDFNNLLQGISGYTQLLMSSCDQDGQEYSRLKGIEGACERAKGLIRQLLTLSRKVESNPIPLDLNAGIQQLGTMLEHTLPKMIEISLSLQQELPSIKADPIQMEQILLNLALNANHAMPEGGTLTIATSTVALDDAFCAQHLGAGKGRHVLLEIADTGIGMDQEVVDRIFEPFFTTKEPGQGTGLGLSTVYGIVKAHGAFIECKSTPGEGTKFSIYFPAGNGSAASTENSVAPEYIVGNNERVLIVDDEETIRGTGREILLGCGYDPITAQSGEEALDIYREQGEDIDLVIMDLNMPGMGGFQCIEKLKAIDPEVCIIVASGYAPTESVERAAALGAEGFISKPFHIKTMLKKMKDILQRKD